ncbi:MAG: substrate-binding domain-containing protein [Polyangiaceae bacterium]
MKRLTVAGPAPSVGFLVDLLDDGPYQWAVLRGAMAAAEDLGANLLCFAGGVLGAPRGSGGERNGVFELARRPNVDGLVLLSGSVGKHAGLGALRDLCDRLRPLPIASIGIEMEGLSSVRVDNEIGMKSALEHVIEVHGIRRIAFVRGPEANAEAEQRYRIYLETLRARGIPFAPELVLPGDFERGSGCEAVVTLLDRRSVPLDGLGAIVASNDCMALGVLDALAKRGVQVPDQIAVVGFDDIEEARFALPPLTTVRQPAYELGHDAVRLVISQLRNGSPPERIVRHADVVVRRSCRCVGVAPFASRAPSAPPFSLGFDAALVRRREIVLAEMSRAARGGMSSAGPNWPERLLGSFAAEIRGESPGAFVHTFEGILRGLSAAGGDPSIANEVVSALRTRMLRCLTKDPEQRARAEELFHRARILTFHVTDRVQSRLRAQAWSSARALGRAVAAIASGRTVGELDRAVSENLGPLRIARCFVAEYTAGPHATTDAACAHGSPPAMYARGLIDARAGERSVAGRGDSRFNAIYPAADILRRTILPAEGGNAFAVLPITSESQDLGFMALELGAADGYLYETLGEVISVAVGRLAKPRGDSARGSDQGGHVSTGG